ncbi:DUF6746 family protein [Halomonas saccharevitans]|uniref:DUF6746 family protein n=1 Tax=Halomonas saccharevitans TaxID=416872 RepID=A0ABU3NDV1_9GAMM|nr:DUF6746 family protein [Halomonas saccharevitans]MDT8879366.1 DUF6746 family protein [Halomonas saccharevitans]
MKKLLLTAFSTALCTGMLATTAHAEGPDHFSGEPSRTLEEAIANLGEYNERLTELLAKDELSNRDLGTVHELSYTLENALARIDAEVDAMAVSLEEVHLGSESVDRERVRLNGMAYLNGARPLTAAE